MKLALFRQTSFIAPNQLYYTKLTLLNQINFITPALQFSDIFIITRFFADLPSNVYNRDWQ